MIRKALDRMAASSFEKTGQDKADRNAASAARR